MITVKSCMIREKKAAYEAWKQKKAAEKKSRPQPVRQQRQIIMN